MNVRKSILATAYAINPYKGSEDGMGWNFILQIARFNNVIAVTRENNRPHIEKYMAQHPDELYSYITFLYFDLPYWMRFWKKGSRGAMLYFWMWQRAIPDFVKRQQISFDITHNVNFHNDWTPSYLWKLDKPFVWGPIGHHPQIPAGFLKSYSVAYWLKDRMATIIKKMFWNISPSLRSTIQHANHIFCMNSQVSKVIDLNAKSWSIMPSVATEDHEYISTRVSHAKFMLISAGRLVPLKGFDLAIRSFADFIHKLPVEERDSCELAIVGSGPEEQYYIALSEELKVQSHIRFIKWVERTDLMKLYNQASVFIFPSHEGAGMVVAEAMSFGLPIVCLDNAGPGEFIDKHSGIAVKASCANEAIAELSKAVDILYNDRSRLRTMSLGARKRFEQYFHWDRRGERLRQVYQTLVI